MNKRHPASFRDPAGFIFTVAGVLYRYVSPAAQPHVELLQSSGLYEKLTGERLLVAHETTNVLPNGFKEGISLRPDPITCISYPYEWGFSQLKDAALLTLHIQRLAVEHGLSLKDASAYNVQLQGGHPLFIDTLSFEPYAEGTPWIAYRQFCQHFLAPLALMASRDIRLNQLLQTNLDGIPLDMASRLLPARSRLNLGLLTHVHLHAASSTKHADRHETQRGQVSRLGLMAILDSLESTVRHLRPKRMLTVWDNYYARTNYSDAAEEGKKKSVAAALDVVKPKTVWDIGANTGEYSRLASSRGMFTLALDSDPFAINDAYLRAKHEQDANLFPLIIDITNPSPGIGWENEERQPILERQPQPDLVMALAVIHHLSITNHLPFAQTAALFAKLGPWLLIEFVPAEDSQTQKVLAGRDELFAHYTQAEFERAYGDYFTIEKQLPVEGSLRRLYLMKRR